MVPDDELDVLRRRVHELESELAVRRTSAAERRLEDFAASTDGWFWEMDADCRFVYFSRSVEAVTGIPPEWHYGKTREEIGVPEAVSRSAWSAHLEALQRHEPFENFVFPRRGPDGVRWLQTSGIPIFDAHGRFTGYRGTGTDVTERVEATRRSRLLTAAIENFADLFVLWDADDELVVCNARFREINEPVAETTVPGTKFEAHIRAALAAGLYPQAAGREGTWLADRLERHRDPRGPFELERQDGRWILIAEHRLPDGCTATISTDITTRKHAELELARHRDQLEKLVDERTAHLREANDEVRHFTYVISHDLRAPLVSLSGFANELGHDCADVLRLVEAGAHTLGHEQRQELLHLLKESIPEALGFVSASATRMSRQITALLEYSQLGARNLEPERIDLRETVSQCIDSVAHQIERGGVEVRVHKLPSLVSDAFAVEQVVGNLLDNALKYLEPDRPGQIDISGQSDGRRVQLSIADNGRGIAERDLERIFQVFVRAAPDDIPGVGMGLAEVQSLVRRLNGHIWCKSRPGFGTTMVVELPVAPTHGDVPSMRAEEPSADSSPERGATHRPVDHEHSEQ